MMIKASKTYWRKVALHRPAFYSRNAGNLLFDIMHPAILLAPPYHGSITTSIRLPCPNNFLANAWILAGVMPLIVSSYAVSPLNPRK